MHNKNDIKKSNIPSQIKNYKIEKELYSISNGHICLGINLNLNEKVLLKIYAKEIIHHNYEEISLINTEIFFLRLINHKNCIKLYEIIESPSYIFLICEYSSGVKLSELLNRKKKLTEDESLNIYKQIISILIYFQEMKIIHLNLNPENIIVDINNNIKLCDFKYCTFYKTKEKIKCEEFGDNNYMSPELWSDKTCYPKLADIWSSGVLFYFLLVGQLPFKGINNYDLQKKIMGGEFSLPLNISKNIQDFFKNIFEPKIDMRYDLEKILTSALFKEKKITKNNLAKGFNIFTTKYPIDERALDIYKSNFDSNIENLKQKLSKNIFDSHTSLYKQIISSFIRKKISSEIDLSSKKYISYISSAKNFFDENTMNNNIKENFEKFEEIKKKFKEEKIKLIKKQNNLLNKLKTLMDQKNIPKDLPIKTERGNKAKKEKVKSSKKVIIKENDIRNKNDNNNKIISNSKNIKNTKRGTLYSITFKAKLSKSKIFDNKLNLNINDKNKKRKSCLITSNLKYHSNVLDNHSLKDLNKLKSDYNKPKKYIPNNKNVIKESKEEEKRHLSENSNISSRNSSESKTTKNNKKESSKNITSTTTSRNNKNLKVNSVPSKSEKINKEKRNSKAQKIPQMNKEDFFSQLRGVKLKKYTPNTYANPNEIKNKPKEENKNQTSEENLTNLNSQPKIDTKRKSVYDLSLDISETKLIKEIENLSQKKEKPKITKEQIKKYSRQRKSLNYTELFLFKSKGILINLDDILKERSKDDAHQYKVSTFNKHDNITEEDIKELVIPKINKINNNLNNKRKELTNKNKENEKEELITTKNNEKDIKIFEESDNNKNEEGKNKNNGEEKKEERNKEEEIIKKEDEMSKREEEIRKKEEEIKQKEEKIIKKEKEEENKIEEERKKIKEEELKLKQEEEKIRKELEEEERQRKTKAAEEEKKHIEEEELKRKHFEEMEKRKKEEEEEEEKRKKEEERIRKEKEKERLRLEEEEKIKKWKEEKKKQKEEEEKIQKEKEEKEKKEEEEKIQKRKEEIEIKRKQEQEENKRLLEEYEKKQKEDEDKKLLRESIKKQKEEEIRKKRDSQLEIMRESIIKNNQKEESESVVDSKKNIFDNFNNFFFSDSEIKKIQKGKKENIIIKNKEKNENGSQEKLKLFYHYQLNEDKDKDNQKFNNRSCETLKNKKDNTKIIYQPIQNNYNVYILNTKKYK